jgi:hypothetical protein
MRALRARFVLPVIILCVFATQSAAQQLSYPVLFATTQA